MSHPFSRMPGSKPAEPPKAAPVPTKDEQQVRTLDLTREQVKTLRDHNGIYFDANTGRTYREDGSFTGFTFERATWTGPYGLHFAWPWLNPLNFATHETGETVLAWAREALKGLNYQIELDEEKRDLGPFTRTVERMIVVGTTGGNEEEFSAGNLANSIIRQGSAVAAHSFRTEVALHFAAPRV